ncbi:MAG: T9SS type A sorting domain-containing protein [bacterium]|nr:T9SS type A sorting domain-containing protein [bacterium]
MGNVDDSFYFTIPGQAPGTTVYYFITAWDDGGDSTISDTSSYHINQGPIISNINQDPESPYPNQPCEVSAIITDLLLMASVNSALLCYNAGSYYNCVIMDNTADSFYASIPGQIEGDSVYYYIMAWDDYGDSTVSDTIGYEVSLSPCLPCNTITTTPLVPNIDGTIIWSMDINNCGPQTVPVYAEIYPTVGDCASGTQYDFNINRLAVSNLGAGDSATLYYWYRPGTVVGVIDAAINIDVGPAIDNYISNCCFEFIFAYEFGRPGTEISFGPGEWGERGGEEVLPTTTALNQNYPNPFNSTTTISFDIVQSGNVNLSVYNLAGQKIESLVDGRMNAGQHNITWDASTFSSGVYFYKLTTTGKTFTKRMTLLK